MKRYKGLVRIVASVGVNATSFDAARAALAALLENEPTLRVGASEFVIEDSEVACVFDADWVEKQFRVEEVLDDSLDTVHAAG